MCSLLDLNSYLGCGTLLYLRRRFLNNNKSAVSKNMESCSDMSDSSPYIYVTDRHILSERQLSLRPADLITTFQASRSGTFLWRKDVVNQCLEFASTTDLCIGSADDSPVKTTSTTDLCIGSTNTMETTHPRTCQHLTCVLAVQTTVNYLPATSTYVNT